MKEKLSLGLVAVLCVAFLASGAMGAQVFFSTALGAGQGVTLPVGDEVPTLIKGMDWTGDELTLGIWSTADQDYDTSVGMNIDSSAPADVALASGALGNPELQSLALGDPVPAGEFRWQSVATGDETAARIATMNAVRVTEGTGILGSNDGSLGFAKILDPGYDVDAGAFLLGTVTMTTPFTEGGVSVLTITQEDTIKFVNAGVLIEPDFIPVNVANVPEPSTLVLVAFGLIAMIGYGLKR